MAPSRKRGATRAAAAAARRQWKVGDLVLAKLKGFPAWPATVSEPEKWGYNPDWKKVLVYFFGTQQIAFCNPADIEPFTEEKKQSLSTKRHGKSADFVRALEEIIDSFDKAKKKEHVNDSNSGEALENCENSVAPNKVIDGASPSAGTCRNDPTGPNHDVADVALSDSFNEKECLLDRSVNNEEKPVIATYTSRKRSGGSRSRKCVAPKKGGSPETPLGLHKVASGRLQSSALFSQNSKESVGDLLSNLTRDGSRRTKRIRKSPDVVENEDADSSVFVSNGSIEDNVSEIVTADSDSLSLNDVGTVDSSYSVEHRDAATERIGEDVQLTEALDFQIKAVIIRKKRKPSRKRASNAMSDPTAGVDARVNMDVGVNNTGLNLQPMQQNEKKACSKEDGDEHLPLVKRARVRMSELPSLSKECTTHQSDGQMMSDDPVSQGPQNSLCQTEERTPEEMAGNVMDQATSSANDDRPTSRDLVVDQTLDNMSPSENSSQRLAGKVLLSSLKDNQSFCHLPDEESALPPSKRLHRALEAMSANVAEEVSVMNACVGDNAPKDNGSIHIEKCPDSVDDRVPVLCMSSNEALEEAAISAPKGDSSITKAELLICSESPKNNLQENVDHSNLEDFDRLALQPSTVDMVSGEGETVVNSMHDAEKQFDAIRSNQTPLKQQLPLLDKDGEPENHQSDIMSVESPVKYMGASEKDSERTAETTLQIVEGSQGNGREVLQVTMDVSKSENVQSQSSKIDENHQLDGGHKVEDQIPREASSTVILDNHCSDKDTLVVQPVTVSADEESPARMTPSTVSMCHVSTSESVNNQNSGGSSPNTNSNQRKYGIILADEEKVVPERPKSIGKSGINLEQESALSSFEGLLGLLTRTKECIARATRMAMDCAKLGASMKVMEILTRNLECESSLHKRVDLFFLVDSIAQCSRGSKGDVGAACLSAIQVMLPRLLSSAVPSGSSVQENRRQCLKVLKLWLERKILPEPIIRRHIRDLESFGPSTSAAYCRRSARTDRALDDPIRDMEGMHVDEYGSNSSFQLPGFCMPRMLKDEDEGSDSDGGSFEAVTPEHHFDAPEEPKPAPAIDKHTRILEDVDGELEMEDEMEMGLTSDARGVEFTQSSQSQFGQHFSSQYAPPLPREVPPSSPPLPSSPPPPPPPPPPPVLPAIGRDPYANSLDTRPYRNTHGYPSECRDQADVQFYDSCNTGRAMNNGHHVDGHGYRHKSHPPRPPPQHLPPPDHFPYAHGSQHAKSRRETPPRSYSHRYHSSHDGDNGNFYNNHERDRPGPYEFDDNWRYHGPPYQGPRYHEKSKSSYAPFPYERPPREPTRLPNQGWHYPPRGMHHHREFMHHSEEPVSVSNRGPNMWRHR
ncbi:Protein HUA2-LIKE 3 [Linum perenne]